MKYFFILFLLVSTLTFSQTKLNGQDAKEFLEFVKLENVLADTGGIDYDGLAIKFNKHVNQKYAWQFADLAEGFLFGITSGISFGAHEAYAFNFKHSAWLGDNFIQDWYRWRPQTEAVFGRIFTWHKVWREIDYATYRLSYENFDKFFEGKWYLSYPATWIVRNTFATIIRDKFKTNNWWYSFEFELLFSIPLLP